MTKRDPLTLDLFRDWQPPQVAVTLPGDAPRGGTLGGRIARALSQAMANSSLSREEIASAMTEYLGELVTKNMLDAYASQAREEHRISLERFIALVEVTGATGLLGFVAEAFGMVVVPAKYADLIELHFIDEQLQTLEARRAAKASNWRAKR